MRSGNILEYKRIYVNILSRTGENQTVSTIVN